MNFQGFLKDFGLFEYVDGHENAFGRGIKDIHIPAFIDYSNTALKDTDFNPCYNVDFIFNNKTIKTRDIKDISNLEHLWGQGMAEPLIALENIKIKDEDIFLLKGSTLKFSIQDAFGDKIEFIKFGSNEDEFNKLKTNSLNGCTQLDIIGICSINSYMGIDTPQIKIKDFEIKHSFLYDF